MSSEPSPSQYGKQAFWASHRTLIQRLQFLLPDLDWATTSVTTKTLPSNASFVKYVRHHQLVDTRTGQTIDLVEKSIRKIFFVPSLEARFYSEQGVLADSQYFKHPTCYGVIETPWESLIFTQFVRGRAPYMHAIGSEIGRGIAEIENLSYPHLIAKDSDSVKYWVMDFFHPWYLLRPRFSYARFFKNLRKLAKNDARFEGFEERMRAYGPQLQQLAKQAKESPKVFCHMDYLRKNLFVSPQGLQLIDWSEVKVGRIGFDGGSYLSALFRRNEMEVFFRVRDEFIQAYLDALSPDLDRLVALRNMRYVFLLSSLWHCMRPETIAEHQESFRMGLLWEKLEYLLSLQ